MRDVVIDVLATYRLTRLVVEDVVTAPLREKIFDRYPPHDRSWSYVLTCAHCASMWLGAAVVTARFLSPRGWDAAGRALALSAVTGVMSERL